METKEINLISYLPTLLQNIAEFKQICATENEEIKTSNDLVQKLFDNQFIDTADVDGIARYEKIMSITPRGTDTLDDRKFRIQNRIIGDLPYTETSLRKRLSLLCGEDGYALTIDHNNYTVFIKLELKAKNQYYDVDSQLKTILPANMVVNISIRYNQHFKLAGLTHKQLATRTHYQIRNEVL